MAPLTEAADRTTPLLRLTMVPGVGPVLGRRLIEAFGSAEGVLGARASELMTVRGIADGRAEVIARGLADSSARADEERSIAESMGVRIVALGEPEYPAALAMLPDAPLVLYSRGGLPRDADYCVGIVGSRKCTAYGVEQAERFASALGQAGLTVVSGGARGIDSAAHRACVRLNAPTVAVLGCGLSHCYPPENAGLFDEVVDRGGAIVSELPLRTAPAAENFPARNRIIAGLSLGVLVIEAPKGSGALITARLASESYGREVMAVPGRVDSVASAGSNELLRDGGAQLVTSPADVIAALEGAARHQHSGTFTERFAAPTTVRVRASAPAPEPKRVSLSDLTDVQRRIVEALGEARTANDLCRATGLAPEVVQAEITVLEIRRVVSRGRDGSVTLSKS